MPLTGLLGGTFDPVHCGHLRVAVEAREQLGLDELLLVPAGSPRLRDAPSARGELRLEMLRAATAGEPGFTVDDLELRRDGPTSTVDTLRELRARRPRDSFALLVGSDAFARLTRWTDWTALPRLAHLVLVRRPGTRLPRGGELGRLLAERGVDDPRRLRRRRAGLLYTLSPPHLDISATRIRRLLAAGRSVRYLVPDAVLNIISEKGAYLHAGSRPPADHPRRPR